MEQKLPINHQTILSFPDFGEPYFIHKGLILDTPLTPND